MKIHWVDLEQAYVWLVEEVEESMHKQKFLCVVCLVLFKEELIWGFIFCNWR